MTRKLLTTALLATGAVLMIAAGPKADLNQDGQVTQAEFTQAALDRFAATDANGDGFLSEDERKAAREARKEARKAERFDRLDANNDGAIDRDEMNAKGEQREARRAEKRAEFMERFDTNLDGTLSEAERIAMRGEREAKKAERKVERGERKAKRGERPKPDANGDGLISLDEHLALSEQLFARMDANEDGVLTKGEGKKRKGRKGKKRPK